MSPFPGLRPFEFSDRSFFFGREQQAYALYRLVDRYGFVAVVGSSGSGKSSLVRAGLLPLLDYEAASDGGRMWRFVTMKPGAAPISNLAASLADLVRSERGDGEGADDDVRRTRLEFALRSSSFGLLEALADLPDARDETLLLVVDQFEELFRYQRPGGEALDDARWRNETADFVQLLLEATRQRGSPVQVLITMRSDFIGDCARFGGLPEVVSAAQFLVPSLTRTQREAAIVEPLAKAGGSIEPELVERLLNDVGNAQDQLPVLQHCLSRLWSRAAAGQRPDGHRRATVEHYLAIGGAAGALSQHANEVMASLPGLELAVEQVFRALSERDQDGRAVRRALPYRQLVAETGVPAEEVRGVVDRYRAPDCSFIVPARTAVPFLADDTRIDVVHEALLRGWDRMSAEPDGWLAAEENDGRRYRALLALLEA